MRSIHGLTIVLRWGGFIVPYAAVLRARCVTTLRTAAYETRGFRERKKEFSISYEIENEGDLDRMKPGSSSIFPSRLKTLCHL